MRKAKTFETLMLEKYPNLYYPGACHICKADLRWLNKIHRIKILLLNTLSHKFIWYCDKCYKKYGGKKK